MPNISSIQPAYASQRGDYAVASAGSRANKTAPVEPFSREDDLARQLEEQLSGRLARIRRQITPAGDSGSPAGEDVGTRLDIRA